jgi:hypothetical protein
MSNSHDRFVLRWLVVAAALSGGCSSSGDAGKSSVARLDETSDAETPVWRSDSTSFELTESGNGDPFSSEEYSDASACTGHAATWRFEAASRTLTRAGCFYGALAPRSVVLTPAEVAEVVTRLSALVPSAPGSGCGADGPAETLTIDNSGGATRSYASGAYLACGSAAPNGAFLAYLDGLLDLESLVNGYVESCDATDGGACGRLTGDAGP